MKLGLGFNFFFIIKLKTKSLFKNFSKNI